MRTKSLTKQSSKGLRPGHANARPLFAALNVKNWMPKLMGLKIIITVAVCFLAGCASIPDCATNSDLDNGAKVIGVLGTPISESVSTNKGSP